MLYASSCGIGFYKSTVPNKEAFLNYLDNMKKIILIFFVLLFIKLNSASAQTLDSLLRHFPIANYLQKPIDTLIAHLPPGYDTAFVIGSNGNINRGASLQINYSPNNAYWIQIFITNAQYITINKPITTRPEVAWPLNLLRKEKIGSITIYTGAYEIISEGDIY